MHISSNDFFFFFLSGGCSYLLFVYRHPFKYSVDLDVSTPTAEGPSVLIDTEETRV